MGHMLSWRIQNFIYYSVYIKRCYLEMVLLHCRLRKWNVSFRRNSQLRPFILIWHYCYRCKGGAAFSARGGGRCFCIDLGNGGRSGSVSAKPVRRGVTAPQNSAAGLVPNTSQHRFAAGVRNLKPIRLGLLLEVFVNLLLQTPVYSHCIHII